MISTNQKKGVSYTSSKYVMILILSMLLFVTSAAAIESMTFNNTSLIEGQNTTFTFNVSNNGSQIAENVVIRLNMSNNLGSYEFNQTLLSNQFTVTNNNWTIVRINWSISPGNWSAQAFVDYENIIDENDETNNERAQIVLAPGNSVLHGEYNYSISIGSTVSLRDWETLTKDATLYFADIDSIYDPLNLQPLNGTNDFIQADAALGSTYYVDSLSHTYDSDDNGIADTSSSFIIAGELLNNIPTTNVSQPFSTGILWDSADGGLEYNGSQDLVFVTIINSSQTGLYGIYDYEVVLPTGLKSLIVGTDLVARLDEVR